MDFPNKIVEVIDELFTLREFSKTHLTVDVRALPEDISGEDFKIVFKNLVTNECFAFSNPQDADPSLFFTEEPDVSFKMEECNFLNMFNHKQRLLDNTQPSIIKPMALQHIAEKMGAGGSATSLIKLMKTVGVPDYLIVYPNTKWRMIDDVFMALATTKDPELNRLLFAVLEEYCHPLNFGGNKERAHEIQDEFSNLLEYDGYCFQNNKIVKATDEMLEELNERCRQRAIIAKGQTTSAFHAFDALLFGGLTSPRPKAARAEPVPAPAPISITIHNQNVQHTASQPNLPSNEVPAPPVPEIPKGLYFTEDGNLQYPDFEPIFDLTPLQKRFCRELFSRKNGHSHNASDLEAVVYGNEMTKKNQENLRKLIERINEIIKLKFGIPEAISYSTDTVRLLF